MQKFVIQKQIKITNMEDQFAPLNKQLQNFLNFQLFRQQQLKEIYNRTKLKKSEMQYQISRECRANSDNK